MTAADPRDPMPARTDAAPVRRYAAHGRQGQGGPAMTQQPTPATLGVADDIVSAALHALGPFGDLTGQEAVALLALWTRRDELSAADLRAVLAYYPEGATR